MAPEVILAKPYDTKADIWGLGITILELADKNGEPPLSKEDGMRAIMMIPKMKPPRLPEGEGWSKEIKEFVAGALNELPDEVWSILILSPFFSLSFICLFKITIASRLTQLKLVSAKSASFSRRPPQDKVDQVRRQVAPGTDERAAPSNEHLEGGG